MEFTRVDFKVTSVYMVFMYSGSKKKHLFFYVLA
jgi:hypothetical protein